MAVHGVGAPGFWAAPRQRAHLGDDSMAWEIAGPTRRRHGAAVPKKQNERVPDAEITRCERSYAIRRRVMRPVSAIDAQKVGGWPLFALCTGVGRGGRTRTACSGFALRRSPDGAVRRRCAHRPARTARKR
ncbi:hypothetical protein GLE_0131 [Lysobacter enzymogenes]|uniref:Uncharacterized protein n=1 Tax=Lysobacter enzymogenes TaxID=69 RepID=A0A0S2DAA7_LYSEN|nr:hypothetical protein GLE_0131 [Lysobacter enzymogenes]